MRKIFLVFSCLICFQLCYSQSATQKFIYSEIPTDYVRKVPFYIDNSSDLFEVKINLNKSLKGRTDVDYTEELQEAIDNNQKVLLPNHPVLINEKGLKLRSNSMLFFQEKSSLIMKDNALQKYALIHIENIENVKIFNPRLIGDKLSHLGNLGEWGMGINIISSKNIEIINPDISNFWGDGIYINNLYGRESENIDIKGGVIDNCRRNGISIISGKNINVSDIVLSNSNGTLPMAGLLIEPNTNENILQNIYINRVTTFNNAEAGIGIVLINNIGWRDRYITVYINNHKDFSSHKAFLMPGLKSSYDKTIKPLKGKISISNPQWSDNHKPLHLGSHFKWAPTYELYNVNVIKNGEVNKIEINKIIKEMSKRHIKTHQ